MLDHSHLPNRSGVSDVQLFNALGQGDWQQWRKPRGKSMACIICVSSGAGGGGGASGTAGMSRAGGGGGGSGAISRLLVPLVLLPDVLFCNVALGGAGGLSGGAGGAGGYGFICVRPDVATLANRLCAGAAIVATTGAPGVAGVGATAAGTALLSSLGVFSASAGGNGGTAALAWGGGSVPLSGGAGGGSATNVDVAGGAITGSSWFPTINGGAPGSNRGQAAPAARTAMSHRFPSERAVVAVVGHRTPVQVVRAALVKLAAVAVVAVLAYQVVPGAAAATAKS